MMGGSGVLTGTDIMTLKTLCWKVRLLDEAQLAAVGTNPRRARRLARIGFLESVTVLARPLPALDAPIISYPEDPDPHFGKASYRLKERCSGAPRPRRAYVATERAAGLVGGRGGPLKHPLQAGHDLGLSQVYVNYTNADPGAAASWVGEDAFPPSLSPRSRRRGLKVPDAVTFGAGGRMRFEEFGGFYDADRLRQLGRWCVASGISYRLW
jgi:hypothetical protein